MFAARTADASVEELVDEPPLGIHHHYCRLAVVTFPDSVIDCRTPPVHPGGDATTATARVRHARSRTRPATLTIQQAVDMVSTPGGKVCLQVGLYRLDEPVVIDGARSIESRARAGRRS